MSNTRVVASVIKNLKTSEKNNNLNAYIFSKSLYEAKIQVNWKHTSYKSFKGMLTAEIKTVSPKSAYQYAYQYGRLIKLGLSHTDILRIVKTMGWNKALYACRTQLTKISASAFITKYKDISDRKLQKKVKVTTDTGLQTFAIRLPEPYSTQFAAILTVHGMKETTHQRNNVAPAMMQFLDTL
tara:strand:- start:66 stop:614 length:549 start_codon:yes stop_codon:yes gene_type:complete